MILLAALLGLVAHEAAHAYVADALGDPLPFLYGRITLNPLAHLDPVGSMVIPAVALLLGIPPIGWGRTVELAHSRLEVFLAGPIANLVLAGLLFPVWTEGAVINLVLAGLNLLPVPGLDGGNILALTRRKA